MKRPPLPLLAGAACLAAALLTGCSGSASSQVQSQTDFGGVYVSSGQPTLLGQLAAGPAAVPHFGVRQVELFEYDAAGQPTSIAYRESVAVGETGEFALEPLEAVTPVAPDEPTFLALQAARAGYQFRYRDFRVRDQAAFLDNFTLTADTVQGLQFLGRPCLRVHVDSVGDRGLDYELLVDDATGLVLAAQMFEADSGRLLQRSAYIAFAEGEPAGFEPRVATNGEQPIDLTAPLAPQVGEVPSLPSYLPEGYVTVAGSTVVDPEGGRWLLLTCTDGVEPLFVLERLAGEASGGLGVHISPSSVDEPLGDTLVGFRAGRTAVVQGRLDGRFLAAVGSVDPLELQLTLESTTD